MTKKLNQAIKRYENAIRRHEMLGSYHPDDWGSIKNTNSVVPNLR